METDIPWNRPPDSAIEARAEDLLRQMTLAEKVGQLVLLGNASGEEAEEGARQGKIGSVICDDLQINNRLQRAAVEGSRLHIPLLVGADVIHGYRTIFPTPLAESCTWNPGLLEQSASVAAAEAATTGVNWIYAPMVDIARDPRWGRIVEGAGEDPFLGMALARARVRGFQSNFLPGGRRIAACPKHFAGYGAAEGGRDYNTVELTERTLRDVYLPPFQAALEAGAGSLMSAFNEIGGIPATCNSFLLRTILRDEWGWDGVVVSDYNAIAELINHGVAQDLREAARLSILAGVDIDMASGAYAHHLAELVEAGEVPMEVVDEAVRRVLHLKLSLGLFENPYVDESLAGQVILNPDFRSLALKVAQQSMVLLKNEQDILPLQAGSLRVALIGPLADNRKSPLGAWKSAGQPSDVDTLLEGFKRYLGEAALFYAPGCSFDPDEPFDASAALAAAQNADVIVLAIGESARMSGEAHSRVHLGLPGRQQELVDALAATGKPLIAVLMCGRPLVVPHLFEQVDALLVAWHGGIRAGQAVADLLFGAVNPSGRLTASWPRAEGQIPVYFAHKATGRPAEGAGTTQFHEPFRSTYLDEPNSPLFSFGEGMSYSLFEYSRLEVLTPSIPVDGVLKVSLFIKNISARAGIETPQLYVRDLTGSVTRPVKELKGFTRVALEPGEERQVQFEVPGSTLGFHGLDMKYIVEPGEFKVWVGPDSTCGLEGEFEIHP